jgi:hypothetical protein
MIAIYSNNYSTDHYIQQLKFQQQYQVYHSIDQYVEATAEVKIAFVNHLNSYELPESEQQRLEQVINGYRFSQEIGQAKMCSDLVFAFDNELHTYHQEIFCCHSHPGVYWIVPGQINDPSIVSQQNVIVWNAHFDLLTYPYQTLTAPLQKLYHNTIKPLWFDALLGQPRSHRDFVYDSVVSHKLQHSSILTYMTRSDVDFQTGFVWESDIKICKQVSGNQIESLSTSASETEKLLAAAARPTDLVVYHDHKIALARILPIEIYNQTAYSVVAETGYHNWYSFFTEKTAKPMMARRLFVMFSGQNFLHNLRSIGFRTFGNVIDESYDSIRDDQERWSAAFEQVQRLCSMDQTWVFDQIADTVGHNYNLLMNTDWNQHMLAQLQQKLNQFNT